MTKSPFLPSGGSAVWTGTSCVWVNLRLPQHGLSARQVKPVLLLHGKQNPFLCLEKAKQKKDHRQDCVEQILLVFAMAKELFDTWNPLCIQTILTKPGSERLLHTAWTWKNRKSKWKKKPTNFFTLISLLPPERKLAYRSCSSFLLFLSSSS